MRLDWATTNKTKTKQTKIYYTSQKEKKACGMGDALGRHFGSLMYYVFSSGLLNQLSGKKKSFFVAFAYFHGRNNPTMANGRLVVAQQLAKFQNLQ